MCPGKRTVLGFLVATAAALLPTNFLLLGLVCFSFLEVAREPVDLEPDFVKGIPIFSVRKLPNHGLPASVTSVGYVTSPPEFRK